MSAHRPRYVLSPGARRDLRSILVFTEQQWGKTQRRTYRAQLEEAFAQLVRFPGLGSPRPRFGPVARGHRVGQHVIIYQPSDTDVELLRILHIRRDLDAEFVQGEA